MTKSMKYLLLVIALSLCATTTAPAALAAEACPNEQMRSENNSLTLPDCRAYELVTADNNHAALFGSAGFSTPDGDMMVYTARDAPDRAESGTAAGQTIRVSRDPSAGWSGASLAPPLPTPVTAFGSVSPSELSSDLSATIWEADQPLSGGPVPSGKNLFVERPDGVFRVIDKVGSPFFGGLNAYPQAQILGGSSDFSHIYFRPVLPQLPSDPLVFGGNSYQWSEEHGLQLLGILPDGTPAPDAPVFAGVSDDGKHMTFFSEGKLYLRIDDAQTIEIGASQRTVNPDPNPAPQPTSVQVSADGSHVVFTSSSELTNDANTGESGGVANDTGRDIYSSDTQTGELTDLTVDTHPADAATGANVQRVLTTSADGSHVYFIAAGDLAEGATTGQASLYVSHDGRSDFVAPADGLIRNQGFPVIYASPDGRHLAFASTESLTGYDNTDPVTGLPHSEVFEATLGAGIVCASCRPDGTRPTGSSVLPFEPGRRILSDNGRRVFFESTDSIVPQASNGRQQVFEYSDGRVSAISRLDGPSAAAFVDASASGDDVFFASYDAGLVPNPDAGDQAIFDARVDGGFPAISRRQCSGESCQAQAGSAPVLAMPLSSASSAGGNLAPPASAPAAAKPRPLTRAQKLARALKVCKSKHNKKKRSACEKKARRTYARSK
jgi:hypothetical protein